MNKVYTLLKFNRFIEFTYFYISPKTCWRNDFDLNTDTYESYTKKTRFSKKLFLKVFKKDKPMNHSTRNLNYEIQ